MSVPPSPFLLASINSGSLPYSYRVTHRVYNMMNDMGRESVNPLMDRILYVFRWPKCFDLDDKKEKEFRDTIIKVKGFHKGVIKESLAEARDIWIKQQQQQKRGKVHYEHLRR
jgi:hypothetical protein